eukprot:scaffold7356_cov249-Pinguiococcus_pyrenoidosus.AAC.4
MLADPLAQHATLSGVQRHALQRALAEQAELAHLLRHRPQNLHNWLRDAERISWGLRLRGRGGGGGRRAKKLHLPRLSHCCQPWLRQTFWARGPEVDSCCVVASNHRAGKFTQRQNPSLRLERCSLSGTHLLGRPNADALQEVRDRPRAQQLHDGLGRP